MALNGMRGQFPEHRVALRNEMRNDRHVGREIKRMNSLGDRNEPSRLISYGMK